ELSLMAADRSIVLSFKNIGSEPKTARTDNLILKEIITNLATNAIKYTPEGGIVNICVRARAGDILIKVEDNGWGIPEQSHDQIFSKFFRAQNIAKRETTGTGLGLYLVKGLTEALSGKIWFKSKEGEGTKFYVTVPKVRTVVKRHSEKTSGQV